MNQALAPSLHVAHAPNPIVAVSALNPPLPLPGVLVIPGPDEAEHPGLGAPGTALSLADIDELGGDAGSVPDGKPE